MTHRPLSNWVVAVRGSGEGAARWDPSAGVNDGDERADARHSRKFSTGWERSRVDLGLGYGALGLVQRETGRTVVEVSEASKPIAITEAGLAIVEHIERHWPEAELNPRELEVISAEDATLRHLLLSRLADEGQPRAELFHTLPWHLVTRLADQVIAAVRGSSSPPDVRLRHWFVPVGSRFTAALDQLAAGLRAADPIVVRMGGTSLCARLLTVDVARMPRSTRRVLAQLLDELTVRNPFLAYWSARAAARLAGEAGPSAAEENAVRLPARLPAAADTHRGIRRHERRLDRGLLTVDLAVTSTGQMEVSVEASPPPGRPGLAGELYQVMIVPMNVRGDDGPQAYFVPLGDVAGRLAGAMSIPVLATELEIEQSGPPIGVAEARFLAEADLDRSLRAVRTRAGLRPWRKLAAALPAGHVLGSMVAETLRGNR
ncbi:hypothetical protein MF672_031935 [Actinomadura sp. ATCC 31491]|uniref:Uncharacterized protein n=1 Tax=Actinomadura luzonensis TaxID=2805427 RepID=A0ABT0G2F8_9ACTN|nr:hypothetical protein [Actinomadura luzonensis]MCK2218370.1 hypothetical protein [Actinomadura luzonensis]